MSTIYKTIDDQNLSRNDNRSLFFNDNSSHQCKTNALKEFHGTLVAQIFAFLWKSVIAYYVSSTDRGSSKMCIFLFFFI